MRITSEPIRWIAICLPALLLGCLGILLTSEGISVSLASPERLAEYHFGSDAMLYHGGPNYRSQLTYVLSALAVGLALLALSGLLVALSRRGLRWFWSSLVPFGVAVATGAAAMLAAWQHNPQGAIHDDSGVAWLYWLSIGGSWFVLVYALGLPLVWLAVILASRARARGLTSGCS